MVEYSLTILTTIISTIGVIMASIFFCCWRKKDEGEANERKPKPKKGEETAAVLPASGKSENGVAAIQSASQCEMKVPLLSSPALEDSNDVGDFSAVQRETDILRSYRKPKPPKRTRQSRAPRTTQTDRDSLDVFTQLNEDDSIHGSDKENTDSTNDVDSILLRQDKRKSQRDTRSSMLADIEQSLAHLQVNETSTSSTSADTSPGEDKAQLTGPPTQDSGKDNAATGKNNGSGINNVSRPDSNTSSPHPTVSSEVKTQPMVGKVSPKGIPTAKPRKIPTASHKPSPKPRSKVEHQDDCTTENTVLEKSPEADKDISIQPSHERSLNHSKHSETTPQVKFLPLSTHSERRIPLPGLLPKATNSSKNTVSDNKTVHDGTTHDHTNHEATQAAAPTTFPVPREGNDHVDKTSSPATCSPSEDNSDAAHTTVNNTNDRHCLKDSVNNNSRGTRIVSSRKKDSHLKKEGKFENQVAKTEETGNTKEDEVSQVESSRSTNINSDDQPARISRQTSSDRDTSPSRRGDVSRGRSEETRKQRRESNEDQSGKGKISKIPVRAGSKPRSTSPKMLSTDQSASVDT